MDMRARLKAGLTQRGLAPHIADAFIMNFQDESGLNPGINEAAPIVPGSRGGYGLYQLTGPRRRQYEAFAQQRGAPLDSIDAQLDFMMTELQGSESRAAKNIFAAKDTGTAAAAIVNDFLRPSPEHRQRRTARYLGGGGGTNAVAGGLSIVPQGREDRLQSQAPFQPQEAPMQAPQQATGILGSLFPNMTADKQDRISMALSGLSMNPNRGTMAAAQQRMSDRREDGKQAQAQQQQAQQANKTAAWLATQPGGQEYAQAIAAGALPAGQALQMWQAQSKGPDQTALMQQYGLAQQQGYQGSFMDYQTELKKAGATSVTTNVSPEENAFSKETGKLMAQEAATVVEQGMTAQRNLGTVDRLGTLLEGTPGGAGGAFVAAAANMGIKLEGASEIEAAQALISQLVPQQRPPGSGQMSDADLALFKNSLPRLINTREGNAQIVDTMRKIAAYDVARGKIARDLQLGEMTPAQAAQAYQALGNPLEGFDATQGGTAPSQGGAKRLRFNPETGDFE